jgi:uncharacterized membrane protein
MSFVVEPLYVVAVLWLLVALAEWLSRKKHFRYLGSALIVILAAAVLANVGLLPSSRNAPALYDGVFNYIAPLAIFFLLLDVKLKDLRQAGLPMRMLFALGALTTMVGVVVSYHLIAPQNYGVGKAFAVAGMFTGTYIGGSVNFNAVALEFGPCRSAQAMRWVRLSWKFRNGRASSIFPSFSCSASAACSCRNSLVDSCPRFPMC